MPLRLRAHVSVLAVAALAAGSLACQSVTADPVTQQPIPTEGRLPDPEGLATDDVGGVTPDIVATDAGAGETPTQAPGGATGSGSDFTQPAALGTSISVGNWDVAVMSYSYGDQALKDLETMSDMVDALPDGRQYVIVQLRATSAFNDNENHDVPYNIILLTENRRGYFSRSFPTVSKPFSGSARAGDSVEGWLVFQAPSDTNDFQLVLSEYDNDFNLDEGYLALTPEAALKPADPATFPAENKIGIDPAQPAKIGETVVTGGFALTITEISRGDDAAKIIADANSFAPTLEEGHEYALARIRVEAIGTEPKLQHFTTVLFSVQPTTGEPIGLPFLVVPGESPDSPLVPGAVLEAWLPLELPTGDTGALLYYDPTFGFGDESPARYFALTP